MLKLVKQLHQLYRRLVQSIVESAEDAEPKLLLFGLFGVFGFPFFYFIWNYLFPQPYENLVIRIGGMCVAAPALIIKYWPPAARRYIPGYWWFSILLCSPFFFTFMLLHNQANTVWSGSLLAGIVMVFLISDLLNAILMLCLGIGAAFLVYSLTSSEPVPWHQLAEQLPVYLFAVVTTSLFNRELAREKRAKIAAAIALGSHIAHELRTPLMTIEAASYIVGGRLPRLLALDDAQASTDDHTPIVGAERELLAEAPMMIGREVEHAFMIIDLALANAGLRPFGADDSRAVDAMTLTTEALDRYPFRDQAQRQWLRISRATSVHIHVIPLLYHHLVFNLLKNSIYAIQAAGRADSGEIRIWAVPGHQVHCVHFRDNGQGIRRDLQTAIFTAFFSTKTNGTGLGLHFCQSVMRRFGGDIRCRSVPGKFTEMILRFPARPAAD